MRSPAELRAEQARWQAEIVRLRRDGDRRALDGLAAAVIVTTLDWALGNVATPTTARKGVVPGR